MPPDTLKDSLSMKLTVPKYYLVPTDKSNIYKF